MQRAALEIKAVLEENGLANMPVGADLVEPPMLFELQKIGLDIRDGQQTRTDTHYEPGCVSWDIYT